MKSIKSIITIVLILFLSNVSFSQDTGIAKSLGLYVFPTNNQDAATQDADEVACFKWAKEQTGYDPLNPTEYKGAPVDQSADGSAVKGAALGAAGGAAHSADQAPGTRSDDLAAGPAEGFADHTPGSSPERGGSGGPGPGADRVGRQAELHCRNR